MASEVLSGHLQMKAANLTKLYSAGQAAVLEQMLNVVMADTNELSGIGLRVLDSTWIAEAAAPTGAPRFKERPAVWKG